MAIVVLMLLDAFFIGHTRAGLSDSPFGITDRLAYDWPILAAHVIGRINEGLGRFRQ